MKTNVSVDIVKNTDMTFTTEWKSDDIGYYMSAHLDMIADEDAWEIIFMKLDYENDSHLDAKHAIDVFSHVGKSILLLVKIKKPKIIFFHGATLRLEKVYKRFAPMLSKVLPQYDYKYEELPLSHLKHHIFIRKGNKI